MREEKKRDKTLCPAWKTAYQGYNGLILNQETLDQLKAVVASAEVGGRITLDPLKPEYRKNKNSPEAYFRYEGPEVVAYKRQKSDEWKAKNPLPKKYHPQPTENEDGDLL